MSFSLSRLFKRDKKVQPETKNTGETERTSGRLVALDAFRGLTILGMLLVNNAAMDTATPKSFTHAAWNQGVHFADLVFPWFLLISGVAIPYAFASHKRKGLSTARYLLKAASRAALLIVIGNFIGASVAKAPVFGLGVLQLIGLAYFTAALVYQLPALWRGVVAALFLAAHWAAIRFVPVPHIGAGVFTETQNLINHLNQTYLMQYHLNGIVSVIPTAALVLIGTAIGDVLRSKNILPVRKTLYLLAGGFVLAAGGWLWNLDLPFNKPLWTSSYILYTAGLGAMLLSIFYLVIDVKGFRRWPYFFVVFGMNAILAYTLPILGKVYILQGWHLPNGASLQDGALQSLTSLAGRANGGWAYTCSYILVWWLVMLYFYRKKIFFRV